MTVKVFLNNGKTEEYPNSHITWEWDENEKGTDSGWRINALDKNCTTVSAFIYPRDCQKIEITHEESDHIFESSGKPIPKGVLRITQERIRQIESKGWDTEHDDEFVAGELASAAACYALQNFTNDFEIRYKNNNTFIDFYDILWPWDAEYWKPSHLKIRNLEKAGALIAAEIERLLRLEVNGGNNERV